MRKFPSFDMISSVDVVTSQLPDNNKDLGSCAHTRGVKNLKLQIDEQFDMLCENKLTYLHNNMFDKYSYKT